MVLHENNIHYIFASVIKKTLKKTYMKLHEIIKANENLETSILVEEILKYKRSLNNYFSNMFCCEPVLMVICVTNATQYARIVPSDCFLEIVEEYVDTIGFDNEEDKANEIELINFQSIFLSKL